MGNMTGIETRAEVRSVRVCDNIGECVVAEVLSGLHYISREMMKEPNRKFILNMSFHCRYSDLISTELKKVSCSLNWLLIVLSDY